MMRLSPAVLPSVPSWPELLLSQVEDPLSFHLLMPNVLLAAANAAYDKPKDKDANWQLRLGGVGVTNLSGGGYNGQRTSAFKKSILSPERGATKLTRRGLSGRVSS